MTAILANILLPARTTFTDANGFPLAGGKVYFYIPNTSTFKNTWQDAGEINLNTNPVILDGAGSALIYGIGQYRQVVYDSLGNLIWDGITANVVTVAASAGANIVDIFSGTGSQTAFTLSGTPSTKNNTQVYINGVYQDKANYSVSGTTLTFTSAPATGTNNIEVVTSVSNVNGAWGSIEGTLSNQTDLQSALNAKQNSLGFTPADDSAVVHNTGTETIAGAKTFSSTIAGNISGNAATVTTNANLTGIVTSSGNATTIAAGVISNAMLANGSVANLSGTNTGDNAVNSLYSGLVSNATHTGDATGATALTVKGINGTLMSGLATGILKNTTTTGIPSIAVAGDFPTLNQNTTGNAATVTTNANLTGMVTSVGNATSLGSFTSANLAAALTDETGTGSAVFATSPILVTPALGTPTSGNLANCTGYPTVANSINTYSGDGSTTAFTLGGTPTSKNNTLIYISGIYQNKSTYILAGTTLTFTSAPATGTNNIEIIYS